MSHNNGCKVGIKRHETVWEFWAGGNLFLTYWPIFGAIIKPRSGAAEALNDGESMIRAHREAIKRRATNVGCWRLACLNSTKSGYRFYLCSTPRMMAYYLILSTLLDQEIKTPDRLVWWITGQLLWWDWPMVILQMANAYNSFGCVIVAPPHSPWPS